ncbi:MAG: protease pro-enzyme activation domain-containing protein [Limisphaerales bacterium]
MIHGSKPNWRRLCSFAGIIVVLFFSLAAFGQTGPRQFTRSKVVPSAVARLQPMGRLASTAHLNLAIALPLRNQNGLSNLLQQIYDPTSSNYRHFLTPEEFAKQFGPTEQDYQMLITFARANGLTVTGLHPNRTLLDVNGSVADIEKIFHVNMRIYSHPKESRTFYAPDTEPSVDVTVPILSVSGLDDFSPPHPANLRIKPANVTPNAGSGPNGSYRGNDFRAAYVPDVLLTGAGQSVGLVQFDGYHLSDITNYTSQTGLPDVPLVNVLLNGFDGTPGDNNSEVCLDIEMAIAMAPGLSNIIVYQAGPFGIPNSVLNRMATDNLAKQLSSSWTWSPFDSAAEQIFQQFAAQGQSFFQASGDSDAYVNGVAKPADNPLVTVVGGTTLSTSGPGGARTSETAWNWGYVPSVGDYLGTGGGISMNYAIPSWQQGMDMTTNHGSTTMRNIPDVAMTADGVWVTYNNGGSDVFGGTSCAAPLWAGFMALVNQAAAQAGQPPVGFINPAIYAIGNWTNYHSAFNDVTTGNNTSASSPDNFHAVAGYDLCTGWGTPAGQFLITALALPDGLGVVPATGLTSSGPVGGPFDVTTQTFLLTNSSADSLEWSLTGIPPWLDVSLGGGILPGFNTTEVTVNLNSVSSNLMEGIYSTNLVFRNLNSGFNLARQFTLRVGQPLVQNGGFETGDFTGWTLDGNGGNVNYVDGGTYIGPHSGSYAAALGEVGVLATLSQTVPTSPGQTYLLSLWLDSPNIIFNNTNRFKVTWNGVTLYYKTNIAQTGWTNLQFVVKATSPNTVLQLGAQDDNWYLGLDDVSVTPILPPSLAIEPTNLTVFAGSDAVFNAIATGSSPLAYHWLKNGTNLVNVGNISGASNNVLTIAATTTDNGGSYSLIVTNAYGSVTSSVVTLTVNLAVPDIILNSSANPSGYRDGVNFIASIIPTNATGTVQFFTNDVAFDLQTVVDGQAASFSLVSLPRGTNHIGAIYSGDANNLSATNFIEQIVTNHPPIAAPAFYTRTAGLSLDIAVADLATNWSDADDDELSLIDVSVSTNGVMMTNNAGTLVYCNSNNVDDQFICTISDGWGGTNFQMINITVVLPTNAIPNITSVTANSDGSITLNLNGASGFTYVLETTTNLFPPIDWQPVVTNTLNTNVWEFNDAQATNFLQRFYRLKLAP